MSNEVNIINEFMKLQEKANEVNLTLKYNNFLSVFFLTDINGVWVTKSNLKSLNEVRNFLQGYETGYNVIVEEEIEKYENSV